MSLYERFRDEAAFRDEFVRPLLNRLGFYGVSEQHGTQEFGKDFVFSELHRLGGMRSYAAQVKHERSILQGRLVDDLLSQVRQAFLVPFKRLESPRDYHVSAVYVFNSGAITANAKEYLLAAFRQEHYGENVHLLDGERLEALNQLASLQSDANGRARLIGLRSALRLIMAAIEEFHLKGEIDFKPLFIRGIEAYCASRSMLMRSLTRLSYRCGRTCNTLSIYGRSGCNILATTNFSRNLCCKTL